MNRWSPRAKIYFAPTLPFHNAFNENKVLIKINLCFYMCLLSFNIFILTPNFSPHHTFILIVIIGLVLFSLVCLLQNMSK